MEIDIAQLAAQVAAFLAPFLPYLIKGGKIAAQKAFEKAGEKFTEEAWEQAEKLWGKLKPKVETKPAAQEAVEEFVEDPDEEDALPVLRQQFKRILAEDLSFAQEISFTIGEIDRSSIQAGDRSVVVKGNIRGSNVFSGNRNIIADQVQVFLESSYSQKSLEQEKIEKAFRSYLEKLRRHCNALPLAALGGEESSEEDITLDKIYIELDTTQVKVRLEEATDKGNRLGISGLIDRPENRIPIPVMEVTSETNHLVLLGNAGAGKSTFVKELLALQAAILLGERKEPLPGLDPNLIPVLIILRDLSPKLTALDMDKLSGEASKRVLSNAILDKIHEDIRNYKASEFFPVLQEAIEQGKILLALDGLDEVPQALRERIRQAVNALIQSYEIERIIVTSRSRSYTGQAVFPNFQDYTIAPFDEQKIRDFSRAWYNERHRLGHIQADQVEIRSNNLANAATDSDLIEMASNPMMLTSIALLHQREIGLPRERVRLYKLIVDVLISRWQKYKTGEEDFVPSEALAKFLKDDIGLRAALEVLAYEAHLLGSKMERKGEQIIEADLSRSHALTLLERQEYLGDLKLADEFLDYVDQRAGLLVGKGGELEHPTSYSFPHRTIQEYLAGCYLIGKREPGREYYRHAVEGDFWSLAALMGAEELFHNRRNTNALLDLAYYLCPADGPETEQEERSLLWSGQIASIVGEEYILRDTGKPSGGNAYLQRLRPHTINLLESRLPPRERAEAGDILAKLGDPRTGVATDFLFCEIPAGTFLMGSNKKEDPDADENEEPQFEYDIKQNYFISRYPVTNAQFDLFVNDAEGYGNEKWYTDAGKEWRRQAEQDRPPKTGGAFDLLNHPVVNVTWYEAVAFTRWLTNKLREEKAVLNVWENNKIRKIPIERTTFEVRLPTEAEWEKAARGEKGWRFPWGSEITPDHANYSDTNIGTTSAVGCFPKGSSSYGLLDMSGNVWEWCATQSTGSYKNYSKNENNDLEGDARRVLRGGAFPYSERNVRCAFRNRGYPHGRDYSIGFRVVVSPFF